MSLKVIIMEFPIRVFISYAWEDEEYRRWVRSLATQLRGDGVDARLDYWHLEEGLTIAEFMDREVRNADKVLVLCSPKYRSKVHAMQEGQGVTGSGWEGMLVTSAMFAEGKRDKVLPALTRGEWINAAPSFISGLHYEDLTVSNVTEKEENYRKLLERLLGETEKAPPVAIPVPGSSKNDPVLPLFGQFDKNSNNVKRDSQSNETHTGKGAKPPYFSPRLSWIPVNPVELKKIAELVRFLTRIYLIGFAGYVGISISKEIKLVQNPFEKKSLIQVWSGFIDQHFIESCIVLSFGYILLKLMETNTHFNKKLFLSLLFGFFLLALAFLACALVMLADVPFAVHIGSIVVISMGFLVLFLKYSQIGYYFKKRSYGDVGLELMGGILFLVLYTWLILGPIEGMMYP